MMRKYLLLFTLTIPFVVLSQNMQDVQIKPEKITENIHVLFGRGGNILLYVDEEKNVMIDAQYEPMGDKIKAAVKNITSNPTSYLINTHWHGDHTGGNANFSQDGVRIVAHENVKNRLSTDQFMEAFGRNVKAKSKEYWPEIIFKEDMIINLGREDIMMFHVHNAHTDGDAIVYFPKSNVIHTGDTYFAVRFPFIDLSSGGSIDGVIDAVDKILFLVNDETVIVPGHGKISNRAELLTYKSMLLDLRSKVQIEIDAGSSYEEIKAKNLSSEYDKEMGGGFINGESIIETIFKSLNRK